MRLASLAGQPVVVSFWATWCRPCWQEIPVLNELERTERAKVVAVALDEDGWDKVRPFAEERGIDYTVVLGNQEVFTRYAGSTIPYTLLLDRELKVTSIYRGPVRAEALERALGQASAGAAG